MCSASCSSACLGTSLSRYAHTDRGLSPKRRQNAQACGQAVHMWAGCTCAYVYAEACMRQRVRPLRPRPHQAVPACQDQHALCESAATVFVCASKPV